ncbi:hypothetical protein Q7P37_005621 [Cladosporium fusiforme]
MANSAILALRDPLAQGRPLPLRTYSESENIVSGFEDHRARPRSRHQSMTANLTRLTLPTDNRPIASQPHIPDAKGHGREPPADDSKSKLSNNELTPPSTPQKSQAVRETDEEPVREILEYDFSRLDYELDRAKLLGSGLWSDVFLAEPTRPQPSQPSPTMLMTPPVTPQKLSQSSRSSLYAIKLPNRPDAPEVFHQEAKILTHIHRLSPSESYVVPFHGIDPRNSALVFTALTSGSLQDLSSRLSHMTEVTRHQELVANFPSLAHDLISGLNFLHTTAGVIHADIKPANILLSPSHSHPTKLIARYADFSASFMATSPESASKSAAGGGTWTYLAPEQLRLSTPTDPNLPTLASDVWSLGLTLLSLIILGSPYNAACGDNMFRLREAIKAGDPLGFAVMEPVARKRMNACQSFVDCCRLALQKDKSRRIGAEAWRAWAGREDWAL